MRLVRESLKQLFFDAEQQYQVDELPQRLRAAMLHDALAILPSVDWRQSKSHVAVHLRSITRDKLHRHILMIRCPDQAFYLDAVKGYLNRLDIQPISHQTLVAAIHCDEEDQCRIKLCAPEEYAEDNFMLIALHLSATLVDDITRITQDTQAVLQAVEISVQDFPFMRESLESSCLLLDKNNRIEADLLRWMNDDHYIIYGIQHEKRRLGLMRNYNTMDRIIPGLRAELTKIPAATSPGLEWISLQSSLNHLYSPARTEVVRLCWHEQGRLQHSTIIGHFSRSGRYSNASYVPRLNQIWQSMSQTNMLKYSSFYRRELRSMFDRMPKHILLSVPGQDWLKPLKRITDLSSATKIAVARITPDLGRMDYLIIAMMSDRFGPNIMHDLQQTLEKSGIHYHDHISVTMGRKRVLLATVSCKEGATWPEATLLHQRLESCITFWKDRAKCHLMANAAVLNIPGALQQLESLPRIYQELFPPEQFVTDIQAKERALQQQRHLVRVNYQAEHIEITIYSLTEIPLGILIEQVQAFGMMAMHESLINLDAHQSDREKVQIITLHCNAPTKMRTEASERLRIGLERVLNDEAEHDPLNALLILGGLNIHDIAVLITLRNHLIQLMADAAPGPLSEMMNRYPKVSTALTRLFEAMHNSGMPIASSAQYCLKFKESMAEVSSLTHDRWFHALESLVLSSLRSNAYTRSAKDPVAIKIDPAALDFIPRPKPYREIFVHGIHVEGVHLRAGAVARGGIRYSDRPNDFRTEVLELMSTQTVKNGQILPTGAKGGFVVRGKHVDYAFVLQQYRCFIRTLLSLTDNLIDGKAVAPTGMRVASIDHDDPYLVVAADKGTARFSDDANDEAEKRGFWLGDAFASGGCNGYDHKKFGITARGAWVCAEHQFKLLGRDAQKDALSVVGIGDMSGDVFGNGMLINPAIRLIAAFNHRHIFLDPNPDTTRAFNERTRLFNDVTGWDGYKLELISSGGGVFNRTSKKITLSREVSTVLGVQDSSLSGEALIRAILKAPVDLLFNGGIGTYVKAKDESNIQVQDPANNAVRVNAGNLRCSVVCEGGNLGFTQQARIEYAENGGLIHTDAIDNAAGVTMSDHEVNLKILFSSNKENSIAIKKRNSLLESVADDVAAQCLDDNRQQARVLTLARLDAKVHLPRLLRLRTQLLQDKRLDLRVDQGMHDEHTLTLTPQLAVLLGHEKNRIHDALNMANYITWSLFTDAQLQTYFPTRIRRHFTQEIQQHPLRASLAHTCIANRVINLNGLTSVHHLQSLIDVPVAEVCESLLIAEQLLNSQPIYQGIQASHGDAHMLNEIQQSMQEYHLQFAEELLHLCDIRNLSQHWLTTQLRGLRQFKKTEAIMGVSGIENTRFLELLREAMRSGLSNDNAASLAMLPELSQMAPAIFLSNDKGIPLSYCLHAIQATLHLLPFSAIEIPMRSSEWGEGEAHSLRREWLHRLTRLKARAAACLLQKKMSDYLESGEKLWDSHRHWQSLQEFAIEFTQQIRDKHAATEPQRMRLMLMMAKLESVIEDQAKE